MGNVDHELLELYRKVARYERALNTIKDWDIPKVWAEDLGRYVPYCLENGSNGERDYMRTIAKDALAGRD